VEELKKIMADILNISSEDITDALTMEECDSWDSLKHMELIVAFEQRFGVTFTVDEIMSVVSVCEVRRVLSEKGADTDGGL
jgi:acyl carrier protein